MAVREFELFHGAVLAKILRNGKPASLRLVERSEKDPWASYKINDACCVYIKYRTTFRTDDIGKDISIYDFVLPKAELTRIKAVPKKFPVYFALVCAVDHLDCRAMQVAFIEPDEIGRLSEGLSFESLSITVWTTDGKGLRVKSKALEKPLIIPRNRLDNWEAPGA